jgi:short-subunit dehydrogenase
MQMRGSAALVTGASRGLGQHIARALAREGADLVLSARSPAGLEATAALVEREGVRVHSIRADLTTPEGRLELAVRAEALLGRVDILVNNAGIESEGAFLDLPWEVLEATVRTNLLAPLHLARLLVPGMVERGKGQVVMMASLAGKKGAPYDAVYSATKAALVQWTAAARLERQHRAVGFSVVCPGYVTGDGMFAKFGIAPPGMLGSCTPEQVAAAVVKSIRHDLPEVIVNSRPVRPLLALDALFPRMAGRAMQWLGIPEFQRRKVEGRGSRD